MVLPELTEMESLLLMAASVHSLGPETDLSCANTKIVVAQAIGWAGLNSNELRKRWNGVDNGPAVDTVLDQVYQPLARMIFQIGANGGRSPERPGVPLFEGNGNWGIPGDPNSPPCDPHFNSCRLTTEGERVAHQLLEQNPEYLGDA